MNPASTARKRTISVLAIVMALFHLYTGAFGVYEVIIQTGVHLTLAMALILLLRPTRPPIAGSAGRLAAWGWDALIFAAAMAPMAYRLAYADYLQAGRFEFVTPLEPVEIALGLALVVAVLDLCRRETGWALPAIVLVFLLFPFVGGLPGVLAHRGYPLGTQLDAQFMTGAGLFSIPLTASAEYIVLFIIFGAFLERSGLGGCVMDLAIGLCGRMRGGPAKVAVVGSALHGTISGSAPANVLTVGVLTIPMMKRIGYPAYMAGAIEAAASTGGVLMPPVMGSVAFIMAGFLGVPYGVVALYAVIPAALYFLGIFLTVHWAALRHNVGGLAEEDLPDWRASLRERFHLFAPIFLLIFLMSGGYSAQYAVTWSIVAVVVSSWLRKSTRMGPRAILEALEAGAKGALIVAIATAAAGMIIGVFELTGVALKFTQAASSIVNTLFVGLVVTMIVTIVLGMGVPPSASYILQVAVTIPMLQVFLKADGMSAQTALVVTHFFVMYYSALAVLTPPDALASVAAAGIAHAPFLRTGLAATRVAFVAFVVPFMFVYRPALLTLGTWSEIAYALLVAVLGIALASMAFENWFLRRLTLLERILAGVAAAALIVPLQSADYIGFTALAAFLATHVGRHMLIARRAAPA